MDCPPHEATFDFKEGIIICGEFVDEQREGFSNRLWQLRERVKSRKTK
jgi:hypothetical protein